MHQSISWQNVPTRCSLIRWVYQKVTEVQELDRERGFQVSRGTFHVHSFQASFFLQNHPKPWENSWFWKRTMVEKNGESTPFKVHLQRAQKSQKVLVFRISSRLGLCYNVENSIWVWVRTAGFSLWTPLPGQPILGTYF